MSTSAAPRDRFASLLGQPGVGAFSARRTARADHLSLEVRGLGPIASPVSAAALLKAAAVALAGPEPAVLTVDSTAVGSADLVAVAMQGETTGVLVAGPESATRAELIDARGSPVTDGPLTDGVGTFEVDSRAVAGVRILDSAGQPLLTAATPHLVADSFQFAEPTVWAW